MNTIATSPEDFRETPLARVNLCAMLFRIHFRELFLPPPRRYIARALHARANAFIRGLEALVRRVLTIEAVAILPTLPPMRPPARQRGPKRAPRSGKPAEPVAPDRKAAPAEASARPPCFLVFRAPRQPAGRTAANRSTSTHTDFADLRPMARRYAAILHAQDTHTAQARRLALRLRHMHAAGATPRITESPRLHPAHARYLGDDMLLLAEEANAGLRAALPPPPDAAPLDTS